MRRPRFSERVCDQPVDRNALITDTLEATERIDVVVVGGANDGERFVAVRDRVADRRSIWSQVDSGIRRRTRADRRHSSGRDECGEETGDASTH